MKKELCFYIENKGLYLEQVLVDYNDVPIFFLCKNEEQFYIALCTDMEELTYVIEKLSLADVYKLLHGKITMRDVYLTHNEYWEIVSGEEISFDKVTRRTIDCIERSVLPEENAYFQILTEEIRSYVEAFDNEYFSNKYFHISENELDLTNPVIDDLFITSGVKVGDYIDLGGYSFCANIEQLSAIVLDKDEFYGQSAMKKVFLTSYNKVENRYSDATINMAA